MQFNQKHSEKKVR